MAFQEDALEDKGNRLDAIAWDWRHRPRDVSNYVYEGWLF